MKPLLPLAVIAASTALGSVLAGSRGRRTTSIERVFRSPAPFTGFRPVVQDRPGHHKPRGLWYSCGSEWDDWCQMEMPHWIERAPYVYRLEINPSAMLFIRTEEDFVAFERQYLRFVRYNYIDWKAVARDYAGIEICPYQYTFRMRSEWYYGWDVASGCIWGADAFRSVVPVACRFTVQEQEGRRSRLFSLLPDFKERGLLLYHVGNLRPYPLRTDRAVKGSETRALQSDLREEGWPVDSPVLWLSTGRPVSLVAPHWIIDPAKLEEERLLPTGHYFLYVGPIPEAAILSGPGRG